MSEIKGDYDRFESLEEFVDNISRGGEIEFTYRGFKYSITHSKGKICFIQIGNGSSRIVFDSINELLNYVIEGDKIKDIVRIINPYFRCF